MPWEWVWVESEITLFELRLAKEAFLDLTEFNQVAKNDELQLTVFEQHDYYGYFGKIRQVHA